MKVCNEHDYVAVVYDELIRRNGCPLCIAEESFKELEEKFNSIEEENTELSRIINAKGLV